MTPFAIVNDPSLPAAIDALGLANQQAVGPFFAQYPELLPLYNGFVAANEPLAQRYTDLLASFLPILNRERKQQQALSDISGAIGQDASFGTALLQDADVIHASGDPTSPAVVDLTGVETGGLSAQIHLDGNPAGANPQISDISGAIQFAQVAVLSGACGWSDGDDADRQRLGALYGHRRLMSIFLRSRATLPRRSTPRRRSIRRAGRRSAA